MGRKSSTAELEDSKVAARYACAMASSALRCTSIAGKVGVGHQ